MNNIKYIKGKLFTSKSQTLVNTVNCVGIMGAGIALEFKYRYPDMFKKYVKYCNDKLISVGKLWLYDVPNSSCKILNFPTKNHWRYPSKYDYLEQGLENFLNTYSSRNITSVAFPLLGAQNGGLDPTRVTDLMNFYLSKCDIPIEIYEYDAESQDDLYPYFEKFIFRNDTSKIESLTGFSKKTVFNIKDVIKESHFNSMIQLHKVPGIGEEILKECFQIAMIEKKVNSQDLNVPENLSKIPPVKKIQQMNLFIEYNEVKVNPKKSVVEKAKLTGLKKNIIEKIESGEEEVKIKDLKVYCNALNLNFIDFVNRQYMNP